MHLLSIKVHIFIGWSTLVYSSSYYKIQAGCLSECHAIMVTHHSKTASSLGSMSVNGCK